MKRAIDALVGYLSQVGQAAAGVDSVEAAEQWPEQVDAAVLVLDPIEATRR